MSVFQIRDYMINVNYECVECSNKWNTWYRTPDDWYERVWAGYTAANADACPKCNKINPPKGQNVQ
jgi:hypothetical protein